MRKQSILVLVIVLFSTGYARAAWATLDFPGASETTVNGIDGSNLVGSYWDRGSQGFLYDGMTWTTLDFPGASETRINGIDGSNLVGSYEDGFGCHGFIYTVSDGTAIIPTPSAIFLGSIGVGFVTWLRRRRTI